MGDDLATAGRIDQEMNMRWPHRANLGARHQFADAAVHRDRIRHRQHGLHDESALLTGFEDAAHPWLVAAVLCVIKPVAVGLPDVERGAGNRLAGKAPHRTYDKADLTGRTLRDVGAVSEIRGVMHMERTGHGRWRCVT